MATDRIREAAAAAATLLIGQLLEKNGPVPLSPAPTDAEWLALDLELGWPATEDERVRFRNWRARMLVDSSLIGTGV